MKLRRALAIFVFSVLATLVLVSVILNNAGRTADEEIVVFAAASLIDALEIITADFERTHDVDVRVDFSSSGILYRKVLAGAEADLFISASPDYMNALKNEAFLKTDTRRTILKNRLVCVVPVGSTSSIYGPGDLLNDNITRIAVGDPEHVPAGYHAKEALTSFGFWAALAPKLCLTADVRSALVHAETATVDAAIVYRSDALVSDKVNVAFTFPETSHSPIVYEGSLLRGTLRTETAGEFLDFIISSSDVFKDYGFQPANGDGG